MPEWMNDALTCRDETCYIEMNCFAAKFNINQVHFDTSAATL